MSNDDSSALRGLIKDQGARSEQALRELMEGIREMPAAIANALKPYMNGNGNGKNGTTSLITTIMGTVAIITVMLAAVGSVRQALDVTNASLESALGQIETLRLANEGQAVKIAGLEQKAKAANKTIEEMKTAALLDNDREAVDVARTTKLEVKVESLEQHQQYERSQ